MEDDMELMELWIEKVRGFDEMRAWHKDLLSVQKNMEIEGWLALVDVHDSADSMAAASPSLELVGAIDCVLRVSGHYAYGLFDFIPVKYGKPLNITFLFY